MQTLHPLSFFSWSHIIPWSIHVLKDVHLSLDDLSPLISSYLLPEEDWFSSFSISWLSIVLPPGVGPFNISSFYAGILTVVVIVQLLFRLILLGFHGCHLPWSCHGHHLGPDILTFSGSYCPFFCNVLSILGVRVKLSAYWLGMNT